MIQQQHSNSKHTSPAHSTDTVERLLKQAEIFRLTRSLKSKLAQASLKTKNSPSKLGSGSDLRRKVKSMDSTSPAPRSVDHTGNRRSSVTSIRSNSSSVSQMSTPPFSSPHDRMSRMGSVESIDQLGSLQSPSPYNTPLKSAYLSSGPGYGLKEKAYYNPHAPRQPTQFSPRQPDTPTRPIKVPTLTVTDSFNKDVDVEMDDTLPAEPQTPPTRIRTVPKTPEQTSTTDGANLLLHFAQSPGRGTPRTPDFNLNDYLHFQTPSPARGQLTPRQIRWNSLNTALFSPSNKNSLERPGHEQSTNPGA